MNLIVCDETYFVCQLPPNQPIPTWLNEKYFYSISRTQEELSIVCVSNEIPSHVKREGPWKIIKVDGSLNFNLTGVLLSIIAPLASAKISIFSISTFNTDYILIKEINLEKAVTALKQSGFSIQ